MTPAESLLSRSTPDKSEPSLLTRCSCGSLSSSSALTPPGDSVYQVYRVGLSGTCPEVLSHFKGTVYCFWKVISTAVNVESVWK